MINLILAFKRLIIPIYIADFKYFSLRNEYVSFLVITLLI
jgi:hypothetical protein